MYTVKILSPENFDKLPFKRAKEALGAADTKTMTAYVRDTGYNDITKHTIEHELDELMQKTSPHEVDGIRYKIGGDLMKSVGSGIKSVGRGIKNVFTPGPAAPSFSSPTPSYQSIIGSGADAANSALTETMGSSLPGFGKTFTSLPSDVTPSSSKFSFGNAANSIMDMFSNSRTGSQPMAAQNFPQATPYSPMEKFGNAFSENVFQPFKAGASEAFGATDGSSGPAGEASKPQNIMQSIFGNIGKNAPGIGTELISRLFGPKPGDLDISSATDAARSRIDGSNPSDLFGLGSDEAHRVLDADLTEVPEEVFAQSERIIDEQLVKDIESLRNQFKALNPNADVENNSAFLNKMEELKENARIQKQQNRQQVSYQHTQEELGRRLETMTTVLNLDSAQSEQLIRLAQLDAYELAYNHGLSLREAQEFKEMWGGFGQLIGTQQQEEPTTRIRQVSQTPATQGGVA